MRIDQNQLDEMAKTIISRISHFNWFIQRKRLNCRITKRTTTKSHKSAPYWNRLTKQRALDSEKQLCVNNRNSGACELWMTFMRLSHAVRHESLFYLKPLLCLRNVQLNIGVLIDKHSPSTFSFSHFWFLLKWSATIRQPTN